MNCLDLEVEVGKMARAMMTRNSQIGKDLIENLKTQMTLAGVAEVIIVSVERLVWYDTDSVFWTIKYMIPAEVMQEINRMTTLAICKQLIKKNFLLGKDFSVDERGKLLLSNCAKTAVLSR